MNVFGAMADQNRDILLSRMHIFEIWITQCGTELEKSTMVFETILRTMPEAKTVQLDHLRQRISYVCKKLAAMWNVSRRNKSRLVNRNRSWLKGEEILKMAKTRKITCCDMKTKPALPKQQAFKTSKTGRTRNDRLISM